MAIVLVEARKLSIPSFVKLRARRSRCSSLRAATALGRIGSGSSGSGRVGRGQDCLKDPLIFLLQRRYLKQKRLQQVECVCVCVCVCACMCVCVCVCEVEA